jgi:hypothetical protein
VSKKLEAAAKKRGGAEIRPWIKSIVNHCYWIAASSGVDGDLVKAKWLSVANHIADKHDGHSVTFPACEHPPVEEAKKWMKTGK